MRTVKTTAAATPTAARSLAGPSRSQSRNSRNGGTPASSALGRQATAGDHGLVPAATSAPAEPGSAAERDALLRSAREVLRRTGWRNLKMSTVLRTARLGTRSFYRHFDSKDALLVEVLVAELHEQVDSSAAALAALDDPERIVTGWLHRCTDAID